MSSENSSEAEEEQKLIKVYMELTGGSETSARNVFMYLDDPKGGSADGVETRAPRTTTGNGTPIRKTISQKAALAMLLVVCVWGFEAPAATGSFETNRFITSPLSLEDAVNLAFAQNPSVLRGKKDLEAAEGIVVQTRAIALPTAGITAGYSAAQSTDVDTLRVPNFSFGTPQNWSSQLKVVQNIYQGGRMVSAFRVAQLTKQQAMLNYRTTLADTVLSVQLAYYDVLLAAQQIVVQEASVELLTRELADTTRRFEAGTVPRFNVLRAEVELANARPRLISARNSLRLSKNNLANLLGLNIPPNTAQDIPLTLSGKLEADPYDIELPRAVLLALQQRTELEALRKAQSLRKEQIVDARAGYKPVLQGFAGYDAHNSMLSQDLTEVKNGWIAGVQLSWNLFDGLRTQGRVKETTANYDRASIDVDDAARRIELEVRTAYSSFVEAREVLESQKKVQEQAEEALRLAQARSEAGTGTQLDVLSAQTALTDARSTQIQALHDYDAARARLQRAIGSNNP